MDIEDLPIWAAYILAPILIFLFGFTVIRDSGHWVVGTAIAVGAGLFCAAVMHFCVFLKGLLTRDDD